MDIDYAFRKDEPLALMPTSKPHEIVTSEHWEQSNCLSMTSIKSGIMTSVPGSLPECEIVKDLMKAINAQFESLDTAVANTLMESCH